MTICGHSVGAVSTVNIRSIHYINLDRRPDRRAHIEACLAAAPVRPERLAATELSSAPEALGIAMRPAYTGNKAIASIFSSHHRAVQAALETCEDGMAAVIEDDCHISATLWDDPRLLASLPQDWRLAMISPRFRRHCSPETRPRLTLLSRLNPFRAKYWCHPLKTCEARSTALLGRDYVISGAHFLIYRDRCALETALQLMNGATALYHVDHFLAAEMPGCYAVAHHAVQASGLGSDNRG